MMTKGKQSPKKFQPVVYVAFTEYGGAYIIERKNLAVSTGKRIGVYKLDSVKNLKLKVTLE